MSRVRSPNYPALSLPEALNATAKVFERENRHQAAKDVVVIAMGYGGVNGASLGSLSALLKYGLLERFGENYRVSDRAMAILHFETPQERADAIRRAAHEPALFAEMLKDFPGSIPSDDNLRSYLVRRGFNPTALGGVIKAFRETMDFVTRETGACESPNDEEQGSSTIVAATPPPISKPMPSPAPPISASDLGAESVTQNSPESEPYRVSLTPGGGLEIFARLNSGESAEALREDIEGFIAVLRNRELREKRNREKREQAIQNLAKLYDEGEDDLIG